MNYVLALQIDFLEHEAVDDVIIMSVVLEEVRHRNASVYQRLRRLVESPAKRFFVFVNEHHRQDFSHTMPQELCAFSRLSLCWERADRPFVTVQPRIHQILMRRSLSNVARLLPIFPMLKITEGVHEQRKSV